MSVVHFKAGELGMRARVQSRTAATSPFTGKELAQLEVFFTAHENQQDEVREALSQPAALLADGQGELSTPVDVALHQTNYSYTVGNPVQSYTWLLTEKEELSLETLHVAGMSFQPYQYSERIDDGALIIDARVEVDKETRIKIRDLKPYFQVLREGISEKPRSMRCGQLIWSSVEDDKLKLRRCAYISSRRSTMQRNVRASSNPSLVAHV